MRQNTKVIVASSNSGEDGVGAISQPVLNPRGCRSAGNSPTKSSQERPQSWSVEPWNGKARRKSVKENPGGPRRRPVEGPVPPLPGQESNVAPSLGSVPESQPVVEDTAIDGERGRLFVKVLGVKNLDLPLVKGETLRRSVRFLAGKFADDPIRPAIVVQSHFGQRYSLCSNYLVGARQECANWARI